MGRAETLSLKNDILKGYLGGLNYGKLYDLSRKPLQHKLNNHMVRKRGWKPTDDVTAIERPTKRLCRRPPRNSSSGIRKNLQKKIQNRNPARDLTAKNNLHKPIVPGNVRAQGSVKKISRPELLVSAPCRRSKRLRAKALEYAPDGVNVRNKRCVGVPKKKKKRYNVQRENKSSRTLTVSQRAMRRQYRFWIVETVKDSNSLFRALAHQLYGKEGMHGFIRDKCCRYLELYRERFQAKVGTDFNSFEQYLDGMRNRQSSGGNLEITALSELYERPVEVYPQHTVPSIAIPDSVSCEPGLSPLRITIDNDNFYDSVLTDGHERTVFVCDGGVFEDATLFRHVMRVERNFEIHKVPDDGNCLFSAISHQVYGDICFHDLIREKCCKFMQLHATRFGDFVDTDTQYINFKDYLDQMGTLGTWGDNLEIIALSELYQRPVEIYDQQTTPRNILSDAMDYATNAAPLRITYVRGRTHYNSVVSVNHCDTLLNRDEAGVYEDAVLASLGF